MILSTKKQFLRRALFCLFVVSVVFGAVLNFANKTDEQDATAVSGDGDEVRLIFNENDKIFYGERREYGHQVEGDRGATHWFTTSTQYNGDYDAYCAQPTKKPLAGKFEVRLLDDNDPDTPASLRAVYKMMRLMIFAGTNGGPGAVGHADMQAAAARHALYLENGVGSRIDISASGQISFRTAHAGVQITSNGAIVFTPDLDIIAYCKVEAQSFKARNGATGTFTTANGKTVTVTDGIITNIS